MKYRIGLDIGIASIGWCAMETDEKGEPVRIADLGVRVFDTPEHPKTGAALAVPRRQARGLRRLIRRREHRVERVKDLLELSFGESVITSIEENKPIDIIKLRVDALDCKLTEEELGRLCVYFVKHRGFRSSRKAGSKGDDEGALLTATAANSKRIADGGYRTVGELLYKEYSREENGKRIYEYRNKDGKYDNTFLRADLESEIRLIFARQIEEGLIKQEFSEKYLSIFSSQRAFDDGPGKGSPYSGQFRIGKCTFEEGEERAPKAAYTSEYCRALQRLNNLILLNDGKKQPLTNEQRELVLEKIRTASKITFTQLRKWLNLGESVRFNLLTYAYGKKLEETEKAQFVSMAKSKEIRNALQKEQPVEILDKIAEIISKTKGLDRQKAELLALNCGLDDSEIEAIGKVDASEFAHLSLVAQRKINAFLEEGQKYSEACESAGYNHSDFSGTKRKTLKGADITAITNEITSPVVRRAFAQTLKVINALVDKYGSPVGVNVEVARELAKNFDERRKLKKDMESRHADNEKIKARLKSEHGVDAKGIDIIKYRLYEEQGGKCAYSGEAIDAERMFSDGTYVQVDHVIPYSRCFDDSYRNKVLVLTTENQNKKNRTPYEYFGTDEKRWSEYEARVATFKFANGKKRQLLRKHFDEADEKEWKERNLNDTKYACRLVYNTILNYLALEPTASEKKKHVRAVSGGITAYLRKMWGLTKVREDGDKHHALDAAVIATVTDKHVKNITDYNKHKENFFDGSSEYVDFETGVVVTKEVYDKLYGKKLPQSYTDFARELEIRMLDEVEEVDSYGNVHKGIRLERLGQLAEIGYTAEQIEKVKPIFVSRMPNRKAKGALHKATVYSDKYKDDGIIVKKTALDELKLDKAGEIEDYFELAKKSDPLLYEALKKRLAEFGGDGKKAFAEPFYKPKADGTQGPRVLKVKTQEKRSVGMELTDKKGYVKNESMVRTDVFYRDGKYYFVPVYVKDVASGRIPNKAITQGKDYNEWTEMKDEEFIFSLYKNDLIYVHSVKGITLTNTHKKKDKRIIRDIYLYYAGVDSSTGNVSVIEHDNSYEGRPGLKTVDTIKKCSVDMLGNITEVKTEKRDNPGKAKKGNN